MRAFRRLVKLILPAWPRMLLGAVVGFLTVAANIGLMTTAAYLIAAAALHPGVMELMIPVAGVRFFGIVRGLLRYAERYITHDTTFRLLARLRVWLYERLERLAPARLIAYRSGDLLARIVADIETLENFYLRALVPPAAALMTAALTFVLLIIFDLPLAALVTGMLILTGVAVPSLVRLASRATGEKLVQVRSELSARIVDGVQGLADLLAFGRADEWASRIETLNRELITLQERLARTGAVSGAALSLLSGATMVLSLLVSIPLVRAGRIEGVFLPVIALLTLVSFEAVLPLPAAARTLEQSLEAARRLFEVADQEPAAREPSHPAPLPTRLDIEIRGLRFRYEPDGPWALDGVDIDIPAGKRLGIAGPSGAGKTTLVNLLLRFWDYSEGSIRLGGVELRDLPSEEVRRLFAVVDQRAYLFSGTVRENILVARPDATEEEMFEAAREALIHDFILPLPQGYDTYVGEHGMKLSGGQRQRIAIARALLRNSPILILDEPTEGLDPVTEAEVMEALYRLMEGRTVLLITHRLVGLDAVDEVVVLDKGRIVQRGTHEELLSRPGLYRQMWLSRRDVLAQG